jgi:hypothetical protein
MERGSGVMRPEMLTLSRWESTIQGRPRPCPLGDADQQQRPRSVSRAGQNPGRQEYPQTRASRGPAEGRACPEWPGCGVGSAVNVRLCLCRIRPCGERAYIWVLLPLIKRGSASMMISSSFRSRPALGFVLRLIPLFPGAWPETPMFLA